MQAIPAGEFLMGSPENEPNRNEDEGPVHKVKVDAFWMPKYEIIWDLYNLFLERNLDGITDNHKGNDVVQGEELWYPANAGINGEHCSKLVRAQGTKWFVETNDAGVAKLMDLEGNDIYKYRSRNDPIPNHVEHID